MCYNGGMSRKVHTSPMTRIQMSDAMWRRFKALAVERGINVPELLGSVVSGYVARAEARRRRVVIERRV